MTAPKKSPDPLGDRTRNRKRPLKHPKYEIFARQRALNQSPLVAGQIAGLNYDRRNLFRIENKPVVAARIAWLSRQDEEALREKRKFLEDLLW